MSDFSRYSRYLDDDVECARTGFRMRQAVRNREKTRALMREMKKIGREFKHLQQFSNAN